MMASQEQEQRQQEFLHKAKAAPGLTWEELAEQAGIAPRALKNCRMLVQFQTRTLKLAKPCSHGPTSRMAATAPMRAPTIWC